REQPWPGDEPSDSAQDPAGLACWSEFHERVEQLPPPQREVFELRYYHGLTNRQIADLLGLAEKPVSRLWLAARAQGGRALSPDWAHAAAQTHPRPPGARGATVRGGPRPAPRRAGARRAASVGRAGPADRAPQTVARPGRGRPSSARQRPAGAAGLRGA